MQINNDKLKRNLAYLAPASLILTVILIVLPWPISYDENQTLYIIACGLVGANYYVYRKYFSKKTKK